MTAQIPPPTVSYGDLARLFLRMSVFAFGGPAAHIAMGEDEIVARRRWMTREEYLDIVAATNLIPGPNSTEVMIHVGHRTKGIPGAVFAGVCFITPAMLITLALTMLYVATGAIPAANALLWGIQPIIIAIIAVAAWRLIPTALRSPLLWAFFGIALLLLTLTNISEVIVMVGAGLIHALLVTRRQWSASLSLMLPLALPALQTAAPAVPTAADLFGYFIRIGAVLFGSGYVLVSYIQQDLVNTYGWLTARQLLDTVAIGQFTPGPVLTTATSIGYILAGLPGAVVSTVGIFLPAFVLVILTAPLIPRMRRNAFFAAFLTGINAAVIGALASVILQLLGTALAPLNSAALPVADVSVVALALMAAGVIGMLRFRVNATWLLLLGASVGLLIGLLG